MRRLPALARRRVKDKPLLTREVDDKLVPPAWRKAVYANPALHAGAVDWDAYVVCVLEQLHRALQRRDLAVSAERGRIVRIWVACGVAGAGPGSRGRRWVAAGTADWRTGKQPGVHADAGVRRPRPGKG